MKIEEMFGDTFSRKKIIWSKRGDNIERKEVETDSTNPHLSTKLKVEDQAK